MASWGRRGSALLLTVFLLMVIFMLGGAVLSLCASGLMRSGHDLLRAQALDAAEAGVEKAIYYLRNTAPDGTTNGSWRPNGYSETLSNGCSYTLNVTDGVGDNAGMDVIDCTGRATLDSMTERRRLRVTMTRTDEDVSIWNNVIFGGVGQTGHSLNGNIIMRGSIHLLGDGEPYTDVDRDGHWDNNEPYTDLNGNGQYDIGEPFTDVDGDGHRDAQEPFTDINGNGICDPPLTVTDLAEDLSGTANIGNNYSDMSPTLRALLPSCPTQSFGGETVQSLSAKLRVKHGRVNISGSASVGSPNVPGGIPPVKETMNGVYVSDGFGGTAGASHVYSDNGTSKPYDLKDLVHFPDLISPTTIDGVSYPSQMVYLAAKGLPIVGPLNLAPDQVYSASDLLGNSISVDGSGTITIRGIVYVTGDINLNRGSSSTFHYSGRGTLAATGNISVHTNLLPATGFPDPDALGLLARHQMLVATGPGDSQLTMAGAFYAQEQIVSQKQNEIGGTFVSSYHSMQNVPHMFQVPKLAYIDPATGKYLYLPPGLPGGKPIRTVTVAVNSSREVAP